MVSTIVQVIVVKCQFGKGGWRSYGERLVDSELANVDDAMAFGETKRAETLCVIVRPKYNERDDKGRFFREWRSFDGKEFEEVRWSF